MTARAPAGEWARANVVDSAGWLAYFADEPNAEVFSAPIEEPALLLVPTVCLFEVHNVMARERGAEDARRAVTAMQQGTVVDLDAALALAAAQLSTTHRLPLADSIVYATARQSDAVVWTQDAHFDGLPGVRYVVKRAW